MITLKPNLSIHLLWIMFADYAYLLCDVIVKTDSICFILISIIKF